MCCSCYNLTASKIFFFLITLAAPSLVYLVFPQNPIYQRNCFRIHTLSVTQQLTYRKAVNLNLPKSISWNPFRDTCASTIPGQTLHTSSFTLTIYFLQTFCTVFYEYAQIVCQQSNVFILLPFCLLGILQPFHLPPGTTARLPLLSGCVRQGRQMLWAALIGSLAGCSTSVLEIILGSPD